MLHLVSNQVNTQHAYDTFGFTGSEAARRRVALEGQDRQHIIPGAAAHWPVLPLDFMLVARVDCGYCLYRPCNPGISGLVQLSCCVSTGPLIEEFVSTDTQSWGVKMLLKMGWRQGRGIGIRSSAEASDPSSRWGHVAGVGTENTPVYEMKAKVDPVPPFCVQASMICSAQFWGHTLSRAAADSHCGALAFGHQRDRYGLSFDPYENAEEFRKLKRGHDGHTDATPGKRRRGVAFGTG